MKQLSTYILEKAKFIVKKHVTPHSDDLSGDIKSWLNEFFKVTDSDWKMSNRRMSESLSVDCNYDSKKEFESNIINPLNEKFSYDGGITKIEDFKSNDTRIYEVCFDDKEWGGNRVMYRIEFRPFMSITIHRNIFKKE